MQMRVSNVQMFNENAFTIISNIASNILICHFRIPYAIRHRVQPQIRYIMSCPCLLPQPQLLLPLLVAHLLQNCILCSICFWNFIWLPRFMLGGKTIRPVGRRSRLWLTTRRHLTSPPIICTCASLCLLQLHPPLAVCSSICCTGDYLHWPGRWQTQNADFNCDHSHCCCSF